MSDDGYDDVTDRVREIMRTKAADLDDVDVLRTVKALCAESGTWTFTVRVAEQYPDVPYKVVAAKLSKLLKRGLLTGCNCGCRGDWALTAKGRARLTSV